MKALSSDHCDAEELWEVRVFLVSGARVEGERERERASSRLLCLGGD